MKDYYDLSVKLHKKYNGKIQIQNKVKIENKDDLSTVYTPGIAGVCKEIQKNKKSANHLLSSKKTVAIISDCSAVLGLGNIGCDAGMPVMEGKASLFKRFANVDAFPIVLDTNDVEEIIKTIKIISKSFGGINLEDISAPNCFEIEKRLIDELDIPVFHDDQHGTAIVVLAGLINSLKLLNKSKKDVRVLINGAGSAGIAITKLLYEFGVENIVVCDSLGVICSSRDNLNLAKKEILEFTNKEDICGDLSFAIKNQDVFIGVSKANLLSEDHIKPMNKDPIIFALANPDPEILPEIAKKAGAKIVATGRSDFANQLNNVLVFPGIFKGVFDANAKKITTSMKISCALGLADAVSDLSFEKIIPDVFDDLVCEKISSSIVKDFNREF